ncbi:hypothetical protein ZWY2020_005990 [Hordeum vulgare]|nr:hypothetical protein ZWY2020_005990 [Hordeum vulgare]
MCRLVMANYEPDLAAPLLDPFNVVRRHTYADTGGRVMPYLLYLDLGCSGASTSVASPTTCSFSTTASASAASTVAKSTTASSRPPAGSSTRSATCFGTSSTGRSVVDNIPLLDLKGIDIALLAN